MNNRNNKHAFTLAEALIILLITALVAAALIPVITKRHRNVVGHGKWMCTINSSKTHVIRTIYNGVDSGFTTSGNSCEFTPPADVKNFTIKAVGGGGGGAGGTSGGEEVLYDSHAMGDSFAKSVPKSGTYAVYAVGGGGAGGGMACGKSSDHIRTLGGSGDFQSNSGKYGHNDWSWDEDSQKHIDNGEDIVNAQPSYADSTFNKGPLKFGYVDRPYTGFHYDYLTKNDKLYTDTLVGSDTRDGSNDTKYTWIDSRGESHSGSEGVSAYDFKYKYLPSPESYKRKTICFAENNWPMSKAVTGEDGVTKYGLYLQNPTKKNYICWNFPGEGGHAASSISRSYNLSAGQSIYAHVGRKGMPSTTGYANSSVQLYNPITNTIVNKNLDAGGDGGNGGDTTINIGGVSTTASGGTGGYSRTLQSLYYVNIPVEECEVERKDNTTTYRNYKNASCDNSGWVRNGYTETKCEKEKGCAGYEWQKFDYCDCDYSGDPCCGRGKDSCNAGWDDWNDMQTVPVTDWLGRPVYDDEGNPKTTQKPKHYSCHANYDWYTSCGYDSNQVHYGPTYTLKNCRLVVRPTYFSGLVSACVNSREVTSQSNGPYKYPNFHLADFPWLNEPIGDYSSENVQGLTYKVGYYGSGGYGLGEFTKNYFVGSNNNTFVLHGYEGDEGYVTISRISYAGGGGGQAGQYINTMLKKFQSKISITIGLGGAPSAANSGISGGTGGTTEVKQNGDVLFSLRGGLGGLSDSTDSRYMGGYVTGVNGAESPMESPHNRAKIIPYGGKKGTNINMNGFSPATQVWRSSLAALGSAYNVALTFTGGNILDMTYGAGGGGGAGASGSAGNGGAGAPGAVLIEW